MANGMVLWLKEALGSPSFASGMLGTIVGGGITFAVQRYSIAETRKHRADDKRQVQIARSSAFLFKLIKIASGVYRSIEYFEDRHKLAKTDNRDLSNPWAFCPPIANIGSKISFEPDEISVFLQLGEADIFNQVCDLDNMYSTFLDLVEAFNSRRQHLQTILIPEDFDHSSGAATGFLKPVDALKLQPLFFECNDLIKQIMSWGAQQRKAQDAVDAVSAMMKRKLGTTIKLEWVRRGDIDADVPHKNGLT